MRPSTADKYHGGVPTDHWHKFRTPGVAEIAQRAGIVGATMLLTVPNLQSTPTFDAQADIDATDFAALSAAVDGNGVISGCEVSALGSPSMGVQTSAGQVMWQGNTVTVAAVTSGLTIAGAGSFDRVDIVVVNAVTNTVSVVTGSVCTTAGWTRTSTGLAPVKPAIPANSVLLGSVYVAASGDPNNGGGATTSIHAVNIDDKTTPVSGQGTSVTALTTFSAVDAIPNLMTDNSFVPSRSVVTGTVNISALVQGPSRWSFNFFYGTSATLINSAGNPAGSTTALTLGSIPWDTDGGNCTAEVELTGLTPGTTYYWALYGVPVGYAITYTCGSSAAEGYGMALSMDESMLAVANVTDSTLAILRRGESVQVGVDPKSVTPRLNLAPFYSTTMLDQVIYEIPVGTNPITAAFSPDGDQVAVACFTTNTVQFYSTNTAALLGSATVASPWYGLVWVGNVVYAGTASGTIIPITVSAGTTYTAGTAIAAGSVTGYVAIANNPTTCHLTAAIAAGATGVTTLYVDSIPTALANSDAIVITTNGTTQTCTVNGAQAANTQPTTITVTSFTNGATALPVGAGVTDMTKARLYAVNSNTSNLYIVSVLTGTPSVATVSYSTYGSGGFGIACTGLMVPAASQMVYFTVQGGTNPLVLGLATSSGTITSNQIVAADPTFIDLYSDGLGAWVTHAPGVAADTVLSQLTFSGSTVGAGVFITETGNALVAAGNPAPTSLGGVKVVPSSGCIYFPFYTGTNASGILWEYFGSSLTITGGGFYEDQALVTIEGL